MDHKKTNEKNPWIILCQTSSVIGSFNLSAICSWGGPKTSSCGTEKQKNVWITWKFLLILCWNVKYSARLSRSALLLCSESVSSCVWKRSTRTLLGLVQRERRQREAASADTTASVGEIKSLWFYGSSRHHSQDLVPNVKNKLKSNKQKPKQQQPFSDLLRNEELKDEANARNSCISCELKSSMMSTTSIHRRKHKMVFMEKCVFMYM